MGSYKKKLFIALLLILLIGFFVCGSANANMNDIVYSVDQPTLLKQQQEYLAVMFLKKWDAIASTTQKNTLKNELTAVNSFYYFTYVITSNKVYITMYVFKNRINFDALNTYTLNTDDAYFEDTFFSYPVSGYNLNSSRLGDNISYFRVNLTDNSCSNATTSYDVFLPSALIWYQNQALNNYKNGIGPTDNVYLMIMQSIQDNTEQEEDTTNELKKLNDFMKSDSVDDDAYDMPGNSDNPTQDITQAGVDNIFNIFYDAIDNWNSRDILVTIPFANKIFWIDADLTENIVDNFFPSGIFKNLLGLVWYYLLAVYIIKDVQKYIDGLQTGEILTKSDTNIKTEML